MRPAFVILLAAMFLAPVPMGLSPQGTPVSQDALSARGALSPQSLHLKGSPIPGAPGDTQKTNAQVTTLLRNLPLYFVENKGQLDNQVKYYAKAKNGMVYFTSNEIVYQFLLYEESKGAGQEKPSRPDIKTSTDAASARESSTIREETIRVSFLGANNKARIEAQGKQEAKFSYFRGNDPQKWVSGAPSYQKVVYRELYPGIDLVASGSQGRMKNEYVVRAGGDPAAIHLKYDGAKALRVNEKGQLEVQTPTGMLIEDVPLSYQIIDGQKRDVKTEYRIAGDRTVRFQVEGYRKDAELIIDPLTYSTFLGGSGEEPSSVIAVDGSGNAYITGGTMSSDFPTTSAVYDTSFNGGVWGDVFVTKLNSTGSALLYSTFLGGSSEDRGYGVAVDGSGNAYITGSTTSSDFPTTSGAYDTSINGGMLGDVFITKLNSSGSALLYSTFLGGSESDEAKAIAIDGSGNAYVTGYTSSSDFPTTPGAYDTSYNLYDIFITKVDPSGSTLLYSTYLGGEADDKGYGIAVDGSGNAYVTGYTTSFNFPTTSGAYDTSPSGLYDVFITRLNPSGNALLFSTFLGGGGNDQGNGIAIDGSGNAYITGRTTSINFPTTSGAYDMSFNGGTSDGFVTKLNSTGSALLYSTFLGGLDSDQGYGLAIDGNGNAYVTGETHYFNFPTTPGAYDTTYNGYYDVFITKLNSSGSALLYSTFLGGSGDESGYGVAVDGSGNAYITGYTESSNFPTTSGAYDTSHGGATDIFITKIPTGYADIRQPISDIEYGNVNVESFSDQTTTLYNDGDDTLTVNSIIRTSGSNDFLYTNPTYPFPIPAGGSQDITVRFSPTSGGARSAVFNVNSSDPDEPDVTFDVSGTGVVITETISAPSTPSGETSWFTNTSYGCFTGSSTSNLGHDVQYLVDWGDGTDSGWLAVGTTDAQKIWSSANIYSVKAKARCATHTTTESSWSSSLSVNISVEGHDNSPSRYQVLPECIWAAATGGGTWVSEVQITDVSGGSVVSVYFDYGAGNRRGPFTLWTSPGADRNVKFANILSSVDALDSEAFNYYGRVGAVEFMTQDVSAKIQVVARTLNGNFSKTFPGLNLRDANTADTSRRMMIQNFVNDATYRSTCGFFNPSADSVTLELKLIDANGSQIGSTITRTLVGYDFQSFSPFNQAGVPYPANSYDNVALWITPTSGSGKVMVFGASANNTSNDPAAHIGVQYQGTHDNAPSNYQVIPECIWAAATGGGTWVSEVQITDLTGGSVVAVSFDYGAGNRSGPFTLWTSPGVNRNVKYANILSWIDALDAGALVYYGRVGAVEFSTQDASHKIHVVARTLNGNYSKTFPGLNLTDSNTANTSRRMMLQNFVNNATYRSNCGFFNPTADNVTLELKLINSDGSQIGSTITRTLVGYDFQSFSPFNQAGVPYPANSYDNVVLWITPTSGSGKVMVFGASANNTSNDPAAHIGVQYQ
jgi:Beta-propeller repeat